jgi:GH18 family chitinase
MAANTSETVEYRQLPFSQCSRVFDATTKTPILSCGMSYYSYDDAESWQWKLKYAQDKGLAGMFVWAI